MASALWVFCTQLFTALLRKKQSGRTHVDLMDAVLSAVEAEQSAIAETGLLSYFGFVLSALSPGSLPGCYDVAFQSGKSLLLLMPGQVGARRTMVSRRMRRMYRMQPPKMRPSLVPAGPPEPQELLL
jgi:hypothetical protein